MSLSSLVSTLAVHGWVLGKMVRLGAPVVNCPVGSAHPRLAGVATLDLYLCTVVGGGVLCTLVIGRPSYKLPRGGSTPLNQAVACTDMVLLRVGSAFYAPCITLICPMGGDRVCLWVELILLRARILNSAQNP